VSVEIHGMFQVSLAEAIDALHCHAKAQGIATSKEDVRRILLDAIKTDELRPTLLVRTPSQQIDVRATMLDPQVFLEYPQTWLCAHGLHAETGTGDLPEFPTYEIDCHVGGWLSEALPLIREAAITGYEIGDLKPRRVAELVCTLYGNLSGAQQEELLGILYGNRTGATSSQVRTDTSKREENSLLATVGALVELMLGKSKSGKRHSVYETQAAIIDAIEAHFPNTPGLKRRTLEGRFAEARKALPEPS